MNLLEQEHWTSLESFSETGVCLLETRCEGELGEEVHRKCWFVVDVWNTDAHNTYKGYIEWNHEDECYNRLKLITGNVSTLDFDFRKSKNKIRRGRIPITEHCSTYIHECLHQWTRLEIQMLKVLCSTLGVSQHVSCARLRSLSGPGWLDDGGGLSKCRVIYSVKPLSCPWGRDQWGPVVLWTIHITSHITV